MKKSIFFLLAITSILLFAYTGRKNNNVYGFKVGTPEIKSISSLAFGPDGVLFIGDSKSASVFAVDTKDAQATDKGTAVEVKNLDQKIASFLGTEAKNITIQDLKVNPVSKKIYCAVQAGDGSPAILRIEGQNISAVNLKDVSFSSIALNNAPAEDAKDNRGRPLRVASISDLGFEDGKLMVSGISNQQFGSTFRSIPFPFTSAQQQSSLEIYHAAHGQYETAAPIQTFTTTQLSGKKFLVASYTCTPLVLFPLDEMKEGTLVKGRTVGEFGAGNRPLDMIIMQKDAEQFLIIANSDRPVMKVKFKDIEAYQGSLTQPVKEPFATAGVPYVSFPMVNVVQLDKLDDTQFLILQRRSNGDLDLRTQSNRVL